MSKDFDTGALAFFNEVRGAMPRSFGCRSTLLFICPDHWLAVIDAEKVGESLTILAYNDGDVDEIGIDPVAFDALRAAMDRAQGRVT